MQLEPDSDQLEIIAAATSLLDQQLPMERLHTDAEPAYAVEDGSLRVLAEAGWLGIAAPEEINGAGLSIVEEALLFVEFGRRLISPLSIVSSVGARVAIAAGDNTRAAAIVDGTAGVALATCEAFAESSPDALRGEMRFYGAHNATVAVCDVDGQLYLFDCTGVGDGNLDCLDTFVSMTRPAAIEAPVFARVTDPQIGLCGPVLAAAMMLGLAEAARDMLVEYAKVRHTFGRPIGAYQAVRHPCADMTARCELVKAQLYWAAAAIRDGRPDAGMHTATARTLAQEAARQCADTNIQLHGAMGFTDEIDAHLLLKRTLLLSQWFGSADDRLDIVLKGHLDRD